MKRKKIVAANWKMNMLHEDAIQLIQEVKELSKNSKDVLRLVFPPFPFLKSITDALKQEVDFKVGAQNCSQFAKGAYTGEVSCAMIQSVGANYVLIGHSERRAHFNESNEVLLEKIKQALENDLKLIFCFGEQLSDRKSNRHFEKVEEQLKAVLQHFPKEKVVNLILAYEPVWAIGTGETASPGQAQEMHAFIRKTLSVIFSEQIANQLSILYGGSCNAQNAKELFACTDVDGGLIGGASLKADEFCKIINSF